MYNAVADGIRKNGLSDLIPPTRNVELRAEDRRRLLVSCLGNFKQISCLGFPQWIQ